MNPFRYQISTRLRHPAMPSSEISSAMGQKSRSDWTAGHPRRTPDGKPLDGFYRETIWSPEAKAGCGFDLGDTLEHLVAELETRSQFLQEFIDTGGSVEFFVGWFTEDLNTGESFGPALLRRLANLNATLSLDVYGGRDPVA